jgi:hypothetical protein
VAEQAGEVAETLSTPEGGGRAGDDKVRKIYSYRTT